MLGRSSKRSRGHRAARKRKLPGRTLKRLARRATRQAKLAPKRNARRKAKPAKRARRRRASGPATRTTVRSSSVRTVRRVNPRRRRKVGVILIAKRGSTTLRYDGRNFTSSGRAKYFGSLAAAYSKGEQLLRRFSVLRSYRLYVSPL